MNIIFCLTLTLSTLIIEVKSASVKQQSEQEKQKEIEELEKEKSDLFKQINEAIDDSVRTLQKANDSDAIAGIAYIEELRKQIGELNRTNDVDNINYNLENAFESRRKIGGNKPFNVSRRQLNLVTQSLGPWFDLSKILGKPGTQRYEEKLANRIIIQKKLDEWLQMREVKKANKAHHKKIKFEKCPRFGVAKKRVEKGSKKSKSKFSGLYPCCRKCCKKSYVGCLKK